MLERYRANGKLLLSAEYFVMDGATALVLPVRMGQNLEVNDIENYENDIIEWEAFYGDQLWFEAKMKIPELIILESSEPRIANRLLGIFNALLRLNPIIFENKKSLHFRTNFDFNPDWGFGSSSTLMANLAKWSGIDPLKLFFSLSNGSGYDITAACRDQAFLYNRTMNFNDEFEVQLSPTITPYLYFVYSGKKQSSHKEITKYQKLRPPGKDQIRRVTDISKALSITDDLAIIEELVREHEEILANHLRRTPVKELLFPDYQGVIKSLGAWGGDFLMFIHRGDRMQLEKYLLTKGISTIFSYDELRCR